jgi:hypothetical protein
MHITATVFTPFKKCTYYVHYIFKALNACKSFGFIALVLQLYLSLFGNERQKPGPEGPAYRPHFQRAIDPANKYCLRAVPHPSHKNKDVARMGHPNIVGIYLPKQ